MPFIFLRCGEGVQSNAGNMSFSPAIARRPEQGLFFERAASYCNNNNNRFTCLQLFVFIKKYRYLVLLFVILCKQLPETILII